MALSNQNSSGNPADAIVRPLLSEPLHPLTCERFDTGSVGRDAIQQFIADSFSTHYDAQVSAFYPQLIGIGTAHERVAAAGWRSAAAGPLFCEQYLDAPVETLTGTCFETGCRRTDIVEVGNLTLREPGQARLVISIVTALQYRAGYHWVLFTAVSPLFNAFRRLGLQPVVLAPADPGRLADGGRSWGRYFDQSPRVCAGNIETGFNTLRHAITHRQPHLKSLWDAACALGEAAAQNQPSTLRCTPSAQTGSIPGHHFPITRKVCC